VWTMLRLLRGMKGGERMALESHRFTMSLRYDSWQTVINTLRRAGYELPLLPGNYWAIVQSLEQQFAAKVQVADAERSSEV
jgi:hypothetical protein